MKGSQSILGMMLLVICAVLLTTPARSALAENEPYEGMTAEPAKPVTDEALAAADAAADKAESTAVEMKEEEKKVEEIPTGIV